MPIRYVEDPVLGWLVVIGDCVVAHKDSEQECIDYIDAYPNVVENKKAQSNGID